MPLQKQGQWDSINDAVTFKREQQMLADKAGQYGVDPRVSLEGPVRAEAARGAMRAIEDQFDAVAPGRGGELYLANRDYGALTEAMPAMRKAVEQSSKSSILPSWREVPLGLGGYALMGSQPVENALGAAAAIGTVRALGSNAGRTYLGRGAYNLGELGLMDPLTRKLLMEEYGKTSPWAEPKGKK